MNKFTAGITVLIASTGLIAGCSTNTQQENTAVGAVGGAVVGGLGAAAFHGNPVAIGISALVGAVAGGYIGHNMDSSDTTTVYKTMDSNATNMPSQWTNPNTGVTYRITPTSGMMTVNGNPNCRHYRASAIINGQKHTGYGTMCRQSDGNWVILKK